MTIVGYSKKQQASFDELPLNKVDILIVACLSYFGFKEVADLMPFKIGDLKDNAYFQSKDAYYDAYIPKTARTMMRYLMESGRFQDVEVLEYQKVADDNISFAALAVRINKRIIVAYRGTDPSFISWKENFYLSYKNAINSYALAMDFINNIIDKYDERIIICGHSKGGHISTYVLKEIKNIDRLDGVYDFDGPGFKENNIFKGKNNRLKIYHKIIPHSSLVGALFSKGDNIEIIHCNNIGLYQHNPFTWVIHNNDFRYAKKMFIPSRYVDKAINEWFESVNDEEKERFTTILFNALDESNAKDLTDLIKQILLLKEIGPIIKAYRKLNKKDKEMFASVGKKLLQSMFKHRSLKEVSD